MVQEQISLLASLSLLETQLPWLLWEQAEVDASANSTTTIMALGLLSEQSCGSVTREFNELFPTFAET